MHAVRGERERYRPLRSEIVAGSDPVRVARAFREALGLEELYVADLDAIAGGHLHRDAIAALAAEARVMVDAGATEVAAVRLLLELDAAGVVIGTESLLDEAALQRLRRELPDAPLVLSLDLRSGQVVSRDPELARLGAPETLAHTGCDVRSLVVGNRVVASIERSGDGWRTNLARGGQARPVRLDEQREHLCVRAAAAVDADYAGVDLLPAADGRDYVLEVNGIPGWQGVERATGVDVAAALVEHLETVVD